MKKIQNLMLINLQPRLGIKSIKNKNFPKYSIALNEYYDNNGTIASRSTPTFRNSQFGDYYFVPKFDLTFTDPTLCRVNYLISFNSNKTNKIVKWQLKFGDGEYIEGSGPENLILNQNLSSTDTEIKAKLDLNGDFIKIPSVGTLLINGSQGDEYVNYSQMNINLTTPVWSSTKSYGYGTLYKDVSKTDTTIQIKELGTNADKFSSSGYLVVDKEVMSYTKTTSNPDTDNRPATGTGNFYNPTVALSSALIAPITDDRATETDADQFLTLSSNVTLPPSGTVLIDNEQINYDYFVVTISDAFTLSETGSGFGNLLVENLDSPATNYPLGTILKLSNFGSATGTGSEIWNGWYQVTNNILNTVIVLTQINWISKLPDPVGIEPPLSTNGVTIEKLVDGTLITAGNKLINLTRGANNTIPAVHAANASVKCLTANNVIETSGSFKIGSQIKDASNTVIPTETYISNIKQNIYNDGLIACNGTTVSGFMTAFNSNMVNKTIVFSDQTSAKITAYDSSRNQLTIDTNKSLNNNWSFINSILSEAAPAVYKNFYYTSAPHNIEIGDYITSNSYQVTDVGQPVIIGTLTTSTGATLTTELTFLKNNTYTLYTTGNAFKTKEIINGTLTANTAVFTITGYTNANTITAVCTQSGSTTSLSKSFKIKYDGLTPSFDIVYATASGTTYSIYTTDNHTLAVNDIVTISDARIAAYNGTFTVTAIVSQIIDGQTIINQFNVVGKTSNPSTMDPLTDGVTGSNGVVTKNANVMVEVTLGSDLTSSTGGALPIYKNYKILNGQQLTLNKAVNSTTSNVSFWTPGPTLTTLTCTRGQQETIAANHYAGTSVGELAIYKNVPYVSIQAHAATTTTPNQNSSNWLKIDNQDLIVTFKNVTRGAFATTAAGYQAQQPINGVIQTSHYYKYDGGGGQNGFMHVVLTGTDNHNRDFVYNTVVYPKADTENNWNNNLT